MIGIAIAATAGGASGSEEVGAFGLIAGFVLASGLSKAFKDWALSSAAKKYLKSFADANPPDTDSCIQLGLFLISTNLPSEPDFLEGQDYFRKVFATEPNHRDAKIALAHSLIVCKDYKESVNVLSPWLVNNSDFIGEVMIGMAFSHLDKSKAALHYRNALTLSPSLTELSNYPSDLTKEYIEQYLKTYEHQG